MKTEIFFNSIYIIESLLANEPQTGTILYNDLLRYKVKPLEGFRTELFRVKNTVDFENAMQSIFKESNYYGIRPYLHFEIHGCKDGIVLENKDLVTWLELYTYFSRINSILRNQLFISLATCYGGYLFNAIDPLKRAPFFGYVGNTHEVSSFEIEVGFYAYFDTLLSTFDLNQAIDALNKENPQLPYPYIFMVSESIFAIASKKIVQQNGNRGFQLAKRKELEKVIRKADPTIRTRFSKAELKALIKKSVRNRPKDIKKLEAYFLFRSDNPY